MRETRTIVILIALSIVLLSTSCNFNRSENSKQTKRETSKANGIKGDNLSSVNNHPSTTTNTENADSLIIGTWISKSDSRWKMLFSKDSCYSYYDEKLTRTCIYGISNRSPQCDITVPVDDFTSYIQTINIEGNEKICYEVYNLSIKTLSIKPIDRGSIMTFKRQ